MQGRVLAIDIGTKRVGLAVSDELRLSVRTLPACPRTPWKRLLRSLAELCEEFDVRTIVLGLPLRLDGGEGDAAAEARRVARNLGLSLPVPVCLQDERHTSYDSQLRLRAEELTREEIARRIDSEAAALILSDYLSGERETRQQSS